MKIKNNNANRRKKNKQTVRKELSVPRSSHVVSSLAYFGKRTQVAKVKLLVKESKMCMSFPLTSMEYHAVLPNTSLIAE